MQLPTDKCRTRLATTWFIGSGILFFVILIQSVFGKYGSYTRDTWEWFFPNVMPMLSLMLGVFVVDALGQAAKKQTTNRFLFRLTLGLSIVYLFVVALTIFSLPFVSVKPQEMVAFLKQSNLWLVPFQGLVSASVGVFFVKREQVLNV